MLFLDVSENNGCGKGGHGIRWGELPLREERLLVLLALDNSGADSLESVHCKPHI